MKDINLIRDSLERHFSYFVVVITRRLPNYNLNCFTTWHKSLVTFSLLFEKIDFLFYLEFKVLFNRENLLLGLIKE